ncbi:MAG TPA: 2TM domain-containing protein [Pseudonocardiaceae bacterium]|jgi:hypothetical protein
MTGNSAANPGTPDDDLRGRAVKRLQRRRDFGRHLVIYLLVNAFLVVIWAVTGAGFFWPIFPIVGWGIGVVFNAWDIYQVDRPDEDRIRREMERMQREQQPPGR